MNNSFILVHAEAVNKLRNAVCHIVLIPVDNGAIQPIEEFFVNPESDFFEWVQSGITREEVAGFRPLKDEWAAIQSVLERYPVIVSSGDGYSIDALSGTLRRLHVPFEAFQYCNAKEILRSSTSQLSYSIDYLTFFLLQDDAAEELDMERAFSEDAVVGFPHGGECVGQNVVEGFAGGKTRF